MRNVPFREGKPTKLKALVAIDEMENDEVNVVLADVTIHHSIQNVVVAREVRISLH